MKKNIYTLGIFCIIFSAGVFATKVYQNQPVEISEISEQNSPTEKSMVFVRDGKLFRGPIQNNDPSLQIKGTEGKEYYVANVLHDKNMQLLKAWPKNDASKGELVIMEDNGTMKVVKTIIDPLDVSASLSPNGKYIAVLSAGPEYVGSIIDLKGNVVQKLPKHTYGTVVWNNAGTGVVYTKVSTTSCGKNGVVNDIMDSDYCVDGLAFYDLKSKKEAMLTDSGGDYAADFFSPDDTKLFFTSSRPYSENTVNYVNVNSVWAVDLTTKEVERLTNRKYSDSDFVHDTQEPWLSKDALWFAENAVYTVDGGNVWRLDFSYSEKSPKFITEGDTLRWKEKGKSIIVHTYRNGRDAWEEIPLQ